MKYTNPVVKGFYPDPSVCCADGKYYLVCSSFQFFPGVPLLESEDLVNWTHIGNVLTRKSQVMLEKISSSGGIFAPTIRYHDGRFYMVTTNDTTHQNFYVWTDDIYGEWSEPIYVDQDGIDPSLYFEDGHAYFMSNGSDDESCVGIMQCEIDIETGRKLTPSRVIWMGTGGRYLESPHMYKINGMYYLTAAEGGTEYGHMITYARSSSIWGEFEGYPGNPVLTNRNKSHSIIQGIGHGELVQSKNGDWYILCLGFRQMDVCMGYHQLGREVFLTPVKFGEDGWFTAGVDGTTDECYEMPGDFIQSEKKVYTFENTRWDVEWCFLRHPKMENYRLTDKTAVLTGTEITLNEADTPTFVGLRQRDFEGTVNCRVKLTGGEGGISVYMNENEHYDIALIKNENGCDAVLKLNIANIKHEQKRVAISGDEAILCIEMDRLTYRFYVDDGTQRHYLGEGLAKYVSTEISGGFTGVLFALYAVGSGTAEFSDFRCEYK